jgi:hypothetical protein
MAKRLGVDVESRRLKLISAVWGAIIMTALADLADPDVDWHQVDIEDVVTRLEATFAEFMSEMGDVQQSR